eukprot:6992767-Pyramimonas_sp.AAC.1
MQHLNELPRRGDTVCRKVAQDNLGRDAILGFMRKPVHAQPRGAAGRHGTSDLYTDDYYIIVF